jgi:hypothetical protein
MVMPLEGQAMQLAVAPDKLTTHWMVSPLQD